MFARTTRMFLVAVLVASWLSATLPAPRPAEAAAIPWQPLFGIPGSPKSSPAGHVTALRKSASHLDLFMTDSTGTVWSTYWEPNSSWVPWFQIRSDVKAAPGAPVTAMYKNDSHLDLFMADSAGTVWSTFWEPKSSYVPWFQIRSDVKAAPGAPVTAMYKNDSHLDVFMTDTAGTVWSTYWDAKDSYVPWFQIRGDFKAAPGAPVTAMYSSDSHLDVFTTDGFGYVMSTYWDPKDGYVPWFGIRLNLEIRAAPGAAVTALWKDSSHSHLDLFTTDGNGVIMSSYWEPNSSWVPWFQIRPETGTAAPGASVAALYRVPTHLDIFTSAPDGGAISAYWDSQEPVARMAVDAPTCTKFFRNWRNGLNDDSLMASCTASMGIDAWCARHNSTPMVTYDGNVTGDTKGNRRALICVPSPGRDDAAEQARHIAVGVGEGVSDAFVAAAPYLSIAIQGSACLNGAIFACATLALDIAGTAGADVPGVLPEAVGAASDATDCVDGNVVACVKLGGRGAKAANIEPIPGVDYSEVGQDVQKCGLDEEGLLACLHLGKVASQAAGLPAGPATIPEVNDCFTGDVGACADLGRTVASVTGLPLKDVSELADNASKCRGVDPGVPASDRTDACAQLGKDSVAVIKGR